MDWIYERLELKLPLLIIKAQKGFLACGYIDPRTCEKTGEACAIVRGVQDHEDMLEAKIQDVSKAAQELGVEVGMSGKQALEKLS